VNGRDGKLRVFITTPLEDDQVERIRASAPTQTEVAHHPDLLPQSRFPADHKGAPFTRSARDEVRWRECIASADILFDIPPAPAEDDHPVHLARNLRWVQTTSSGVGPLVERLGLVQRGVTVTTARGVHARPLTEFVFMALLTHAKRLAHLRREQAARRWQRYCGGALAGGSLSIVGMGEVGRQVALLGKSFGMRVAGLVRRESAADAPTLGVDAVYRHESLHQMLAETDALVLCAPHTPETGGMIDAAALRSLKPGAVLVNIARGQLVDESALIDALRSGRRAFAALDVFEVEPLPAGNPLWDLDNVLVSPHSASTEGGENARITDIFCHNLACFLEGRVDEMQNLFNAERGY